MASDEVTPEAILQLGFGFWGAKALLTAVEFDLFTELAAAGPTEADALIGRLGLDGRGARDFFDALVALRVLERDDAGRYANTPAANRFLDRAKPSYIGGVLEMANARLYGFWGALGEALRTGRPQNEAKEGGDLFGQLYADPARLKSFLKAMTGVSLGAAQAIAAKFPWADRRTVIDIGAAEGALAVELVRAHPHLSGGGFDLPPVKPHFEAYVAAHGFADRLVFHGGDFFRDKLPAADVLVMGHILHDWGIDEKRRLIAKAYDALPPGGALIVYDAMIDEERRENAFGLLMSLNMLIETTSGADYTAAECIGWMRDAGFRKATAEHLLGPDSMVVAVK